jgi:hypothetical protein
MLTNTGVVGEVLSFLWQRKLWVDDSYGYGAFTLWLTVGFRVIFRGGSFYLYPFLKDV